MENNISNGNCTLLARGLAAFCAIMLAMGLGLTASPAEAAPFAYVTNFSAPGIVSVIDTATNIVVATILVGNSPTTGVAVAPDGKHAYVANFGATVSVIDTTINAVVATVPGVGGLGGIAVTPDGKHIYVANGCGTVSVIDTVTNTVVVTVQGVGESLGIAITPDGKRAYVANNGTVSVIDTATNRVVATVPVAPEPEGIAITPDGKRAYVAIGFGTVQVINTANNTVVATVPVGGFPDAVAGTPDGKHAYVTNSGTFSVPGTTVSVIDTASNTVVKTVLVGTTPGGVAVTPDGKHVYVANQGSNNVSVVDTATNTVVATVPVGNGPTGVGIVPPPPGIPFSAFNATLAIHFGGAPNQDTLKLQSSFTLGSASNGIKPATEAVKLQVGTFATTIPPGSFQELAGGPFLFQGVIDGVALDVLITPTGTKRFALTADAKGANLTGTKNEVQVSLIIGDDSGTTSVKAQISGTAPVTAQIAH